MATKIFDENNNLKGYSINIDGKDTFIPTEQAKDLYNTLLTEYHREDVVLELEYRDDIEIPTDKKESVISKILDLYEENLEKGYQTWGEALDDAVNDVVYPDYA